MSVINTNVKALAAQASMSNVNKSMETAMERLSTGIRINSAKDDAAGLAIALRMTADIRGTAVAIRNANDGISLSQTAEGGLGQINDILQRMRELAVQSSNGTASADNRAASQLEITQLKQEIDTIAGRTNFNGIKLLDGTAAKLSIQTGVNAGDMMTMNISAARTQDIGVGGRASLTATGTSGATQGSLAKNLNAGDLIINGTQVGASRDIDDNVSANPFETVTFTFTTGAGASTDILTVDGTGYTASGVLSAANTRNAFVTYFNANNTNYSATSVDIAGVQLVAKTTGNKTSAVFAVTGSSATIATSTVQYINGGGDQSSSAIAKAAAINAVSAQSGVVATVGSTVVAGSAQNASALTGQIFINGVGTGSFSTTGDAGVSRSNTVAAINLISGQTGVRAVDTGDVNKGVQLIADDGRNIIVGYNTLTAATTGVAAAGVNTGSFQLTSTSGGDINLSTSSSGTISNAGLSVGAFKANVSTVTSTSRASALTTVAPSDSTTGVLAAGTMRINGVAIDAAATASDTASDVTATSSTKAASAIAIAAAINAKTGLTGVSAKANANVIIGTEFDATGSAAKVLRLNGINIALSVEQSSTRGGIVTEINKFTGQTGVVASDNGRGLTLTAADGRNISIALETNNTTATTNEVGGTGALWRAKNIGLAIGVLSVPHLFSHATAAPATAAATTYAGVTLTSELAFNLEGGSDGNTNFSLLGFKTGTFGGSNNGIKISNIDVGSQSGAQLAITALDAAMKSVSMNQAQLGAYQNRLESAIANLTEGSTNMNASRSRVLDTDYAKESTNLAKAQIITQAATAMLAQANQSAQSVLALLK